MTNTPAESTSSSSAYLNSITAAQDGKNQSYSPDNSENRHEIYHRNNQLGDDYQAENITEKEVESERCQVHGKKLKYVCWQDQEKICSECVIFGSHKNPKCPDIRPLEALNQAIGSTKGRCKGLIPIIDKFWENAKNLCQEQMKAALSVIQTRFNELRFMLNAKEAEFVFEISSFYDAEIEKLRPQVGEHSFAREFLQGKIDDYEAITLKAKPFELLEEDLEASFNMIQDMVNLNRVAQMEEVFQQIKSSIDLKLSNQRSVLEKVGVWSEDLTSMCQEVDLKLNDRLSSRRELEKYKDNWIYSQTLNGYEKDMMIVDGYNLEILYPFSMQATQNLDVLKDTEEIKSISSLEFKIRGIS